MRKQTFLFFKIAATFLVCFVLLQGVRKSLPIVRSKESFRSAFPVEKFLAKISMPIPSWVQNQIERDLSFFLDSELGAEAIYQTHLHILDKIGKGASFYHYRILDRKLYKWVPDGERLAYVDTALEKALKTLLIYAPVPDVDFILSSMDGVPEPYMPENFFLVEDSRLQAPILAQAKRNHSSTSCVVLIPDQFSLHPNWGKLSEEIIQCSQKILWEAKKEIAVWRGGLTDMGVPNGFPVFDLLSCPRFQIAKCSCLSPFLVDAGITWGSAPQGGRLEEEGVLRGALSQEEHLAYKYLPVLDGHMCTYPGYQWRLLSNSAAFKQDSDQIQWFYGELQPYVHYVPVAHDMSDLAEKVIWAKSHDAEVLEIMKRAQMFAVRNLMLEDNYAYLFHVLKRLAEIEVIDFQKLKEDTGSDPHWKCIQYRKRLSLQKSLRKISKILFRS